MMRFVNWIWVAGALVLVGGCTRKGPLPPLQVQHIAEEVTYELPPRHEGCTRRRTLNLAFDLQYPLNDPALEAWMASRIGGEAYVRINGRSFLPGSALEGKVLPEPETILEGMNRILLAGMEAFREERDGEDETAFWIPCKGECRESDARDVNLKLYEYDLTCVILPNDARYCSYYTREEEAPYSASHTRKVCGVFDRQLGSQVTIDDLIHGKQLGRFLAFFYSYLWFGNIDEAAKEATAHHREALEGYHAALEPDNSEAWDLRNTLNNFIFTPEGILWAEIHCGSSYRERLFSWELLRPYLRDKTLADRFRNPAKHPLRGH